MSDLLFTCLNVSFIHVRNPHAYGKFTPLVSNYIPTFTFNSDGALFGTTITREANKRKEALCLFLSPFFSRCAIVSLNGVVREKV